MIGRNDTTLRTTRQFFLVLIFAKIKILLMFVLKTNAIWLSKCTFCEKTDRMVIKIGQTFVRIGRNGSQKLQVQNFPGEHAKEPLLINSVELVIRASYCSPRNLKYAPRSLLEHFFRQIQNHG